MSRFNIKRLKNELLHQNIKSYSLGFVASALLTLAAYFSVVRPLFEGIILKGVLLALALVQVALQLVLFLHLGEEKKPRYNLLVLLFMVSVALIVIIGSIWIMYHLNYNMILT